MNDKPKLKARQLKEFENAQKKIRIFRTDPSRTLPTDEEKLL